MLLRQEVERRKLIIIRKLLGLGLTEINGQTLDQLTLTQLEGILIASLQVLEGKTMPKQLTIFDVEPVLSFDPKKAHIHRLNSRLRYADVVVQIPRQVKAIDELKPTTAPDERYELFEDYTIGIWRYKRAEDKEFVWEEAEQMCKRARDEKKPIPIRLYLSLEQSFVPENVVRYL